MLRPFLIAVAIALLAGVLPASAQGGGSCAEWCRANRCTGGLSGNMQPVCMNKCIPACEQKRSKHK
jgi:hypothetical protein